MCPDKEVNIRDLSIDLGERWVKGVPAHPKARELAALIGAIDFHHNNDANGISFGGDGNNGEDLIMILSEIFERKLFSLE